jgi:hypothetical protein
LLLHVRCFEFQTQIRNLYSSNLTGQGLLYLHTITSHYAEFFESYDLRSASTEQGEALLAIIKPILLRFTNRHMSEALEEVRFE